MIISEPCCFADLFAVFSKAEKRKIQTASWVSYGIEDKYFRDISFLKNWKQGEMMNMAESSFDFFCFPKLLVQLHQKSILGKSLQTLSNTF